MHNNGEMLSHLARELQLPGLAFSNEGLCELVIGEQTVALWGQPGETSLRLSGVVGNLPDPDSAAALRLLLHANFIGHGSGRSALSMDPVSYEVVLGRAVDVASLGPQGLIPVLEEFVNHLVGWSNNLERLAADAQRDEAPPAGSPVPANLRV